MSRFSTFPYGSYEYGSTRGLSRSSLFAQVLDYTSVYLEVQAPTQVNKNFVVVRTRTGSAEDPSSGLVIATGAISSPQFTIMDGADLNIATTLASNVATPPGLVYYTLFVFDAQGSWNKEATTSVLVPHNKGTIDYFQYSLPGMYTSEDHNPVSPATTDNDLYRFLYGFALTYDELSSAIDMILPEFRTRSTIRRLHDAYSKGVGMPIEYTIGVGANARLYRSAGYIYRNKGTVAAIGAFAEALTGWQTVVVESHNRLLSLDDASFETSTGNWGATGGSLSTVVLDGTTVTGPSWANETASAPFARSHVGKFTLSAASGTLALPGDRSRLKSVPVTAGTTYYFRAPVRAVTGTPTVKPQIEWLSEEGTALSTTDLASAATTTSWVLRSGSAVAPAGASFAVLKFAVSGSVSDAIHLDMLSFSDEDRLYRDPRSVDVICQPDRTNLILDPSFELSGSSTWVAVAGSVTSSIEQHMMTGHSGKVTGATWEVRQAGTIPVVGYYSYSLSAYAYSASGTATARIKWYDNTDTLIRTDDESWGTLGSSWTRLDALVTSPANATHAVVSFTGTDTTYLDLVMFERTDRSQIFFSGLFSDITGSDGIWAGSANQSYSLLYANKAVKVTRLKQTLPYYLPVGVTSRVLLWDSPDTAVQSLVPIGA